MQNTPKEMLSEQMKLLAGRAKNKDCSVADLCEISRTMIALPESIDEQILELRKDNRFIRCSYSEIVRRAMEHGLSLLQAEAAGPGDSCPAPAENMQDSA